MSFPRMFESQTVTAEDLEASLRQTNAALRAFKEEQKKQTEQLEKLVNVAKGIGKAVVCAESRQDAWSGVVVIKLSSLR
jgi:DNA-directed RNA polymerase